MILNPDMKKMKLDIHIQESISYVFQKICHVQF